MSIKIKNPKAFMIIEGLVALIFIATTATLLITSSTKDSIISSLTSQNTTLKATNEQYVLRIASLRSELEKSTAQLKDLENEYSKLEKEYGDLEVEKAKLEVEIKQLKEEIEKDEEMMQELLTLYEEAIAAGITYSVFYVHGDEILKETSVYYGNDVPSEIIPLVPYKENSFGRWTSDGKGISKNTIIFAEYKNGTVSLEGEAKVGSTLTASYFGEINDVTYSWFINDEFVVSGTDKYAIGSADYNKTIKVVVNATGYTSFVTSCATVTM